MLLAVAFCLISCVIQRSFQVNITAKCCEKNFEVVEGNFTVPCAKKINTRYQVRADSYNFLKNNSDDGECVDWNGQDFLFYHVNGSIFEPIHRVSMPVFPKCCPLNHVYNNKTHSCVNSPNATEDFIEGQFVKVGLPHCRMIADKYFKNHFEATAWLRDLEPGNHCLDNDVNDEFVIRECQEGLYLCEQKRCFKKCCPDGQSYVGGGFCKDTYVHGIQLDSQGYSPYIEDLEDDHELIYGAGCPKVTLMTKNKMQFSFKKKGEFRYYYNFTGQFEEHHYSNLKSYCLEHATKGSFSGYNLFWCINEDALDDKFSNTLWAKILSCVFLLVIIVVYFYLGETRSTFGKILINYCVAMICLMAILTVAHISRKTSRLECKLRAYSLIFFNMSAFAWVNVMSLDIWWTFGTPRRTIGSDQRKKDLKKFLLYMLYGWGTPLCHTLLILIFDSTRVLPESIQPYLGIYKCFLENRNYSRTVFFLIPQLTFQIFNTVLFIKTIVYCIRVKNEISRMNDTSRSKENGKYTDDMERLALIVKLAVIMGVIWIFEVSTAFFENMKSFSNFTKTLEVILDTITCLQGVFIFLIFICKKKTFNNIKTKLGLGERRISCSMSSVTQTSVTNGHYPMNKRQTTMSINEHKL